MATRSGRARARRPALHYPRDPDTTFVEQRHRQLERHSEAENELGYERIILLHRPGWRPAERFGVAKKEQDGFWQQPKIANEDAEEKETEASNNRRKQKTFFHRGERGQNELGQEIKQ